jgi:hypothetical protein
MKQWIELDNTYLTDGPPKQREYEAVLLVNRCEYRTKVKAPYVRRVRSAETLKASTKRELTEKVAAFATRRGVRLLRPTISANQLPTEVRGATKQIRQLIRGTADIYAND